MEKRLFIAIKYQPNTDFLVFFDKIKKNLNPYASIKWVEPYNLHLTIIFLGNTDTLVIPFVNNALQSVEKECSSFMLKIGNLSTFKHQQQPTVVWMGIIPSIAVNKLYNLTLHYLEQEFQKIIPKITSPLLEKNKNFNPHLTLGRIKYVRNLKSVNDFIRSHEHAFHTFWDVSYISLYESILSPGGPLYKVVSSFKLKTSNNF